MSPVTNAVGLKVAGGPGIGKCDCLYSQGALLIVDGRMLRLLQVCATLALCRKETGGMVRWIWELYFCGRWRAQNGPRFPPKLGTLVRNHQVLGGILKCPF